MPYIVPWNSVAILSSNSGDGALLGKKGDQPHQIFTMADHLRLELPLGNLSHSADFCLQIDPKNAIF